MFIRDTGKIIISWLRRLHRWTETLQQMLRYIHSGSYKELEQLYGNGEDNGGFLAQTDGIKSLEVAQLHSYGMLTDLQCGKFERRGGTHLAFSGDDLCRGLTSRLRFGRHCALQLDGQADILDLHSLHFYAPRLCDGVKALLSARK